jgi:hypothetical protein
MDTLSRV